MANEQNDTQETPAAENVAPKTFNLQDFLMSEKEVEELSVWVEFKHGISFHLRYIPRSELQRITRDSTEMKWSDEAKGRVAQISSDKLVPAFCRRAVKDWKGVTPTSLANLVPIKLDKVPEQAREMSIPFTQKQLHEVVKTAFELDVFLQQSASDLSLFNPDQEPEAKN